MGVAFSSGLFFPAMVHFQRIGIVGCGQIGCGIARMAAVAGYEVHICETNQDTLDRSFTESLQFFKRQAIRGVLNEEDARAVASRIRGSLDVQDLEGCGMIIEAIPENFEKKTRLLKTLDQLYPPPVVLATHSIALSITQLAATVQRPERILGLHFLPPVHHMKLAEVVKTENVLPSVLESACDFIRSLQKEPVIVADFPGFIVTRLIIAYVLNAIRIFEAGVATKEDIDKAMELGSGHPIGPFALMDVLGLDTTYRLANAFFQEYHDPQYAPPPLLTQLVEQGHWGQKTGQGFYTYRQQQQ